MINIGTEPAGRLRNVLQVFRGGDQNRSLTEWWIYAAPLLASGGDHLSVRAEAGTLLRDVELAIRALPIDDNQEQYLELREKWGLPIFGHGLNDAPASKFGPGSLVDSGAFNMLSSLSSILRRDTPDFETLVEPGEIDSRLDEIYSKLGHLLVEAQSDPTIPSTWRRRVSTVLISAMEDITFVRFRGLSRLSFDTSAANAEITKVADEARAIDPQGTLAKRTLSWIQNIRDIVVAVEQVVIPTATFFTVAVGTHDIQTAITSALASRLALASRSSSPLKEIENNDPQEPKDQSNNSDDPH